MAEFFDSLHYSDFWSLLITAGICMYIGQYASGGVPNYCRMARIGFIVAFIAYLLTGMQSNDGGSAVLLAIAIRGVLVGGVVYGAILLAAPALIWTRDTLIVGPIESFQRAVRSQRARREERRRAREAERARIAAQTRWESEAPVREQARLDAERRQREETAAQKRREDARAEVELLYSLYKPEISDRFPQEAFDAFLAKYMQDNQSADYVEERARQLQDIILQHREKAAPTPKFKSLSDLTRWFEAQRDEIERVTDGRTRSRLLIQLKERYSDLTSQLLEEI